MAEARPPDRLFFEAPAFRDLDAAAFTFAFELSYHDGSGQPIERSAFRLREISDAMSRSRGGEGREREAFATLVQPIRSFLDDVTMGPAGTNGRPALFAASGARPNARSRSVWLCRPETWQYEYENEVSELAVEPAQRFHHFRLRDSFAAFESGRIFYLLTLTQQAPGDEATRKGESEQADPDMACDTQRAPIDEYTVLQLQQLALDPDEYADDATYLAFCRDRESPVDTTGFLSLIQLAEQRLQELEANNAARPNGIADVMRARDMIADDCRRRPLTADSLQRLAVGIESDTLLGTADRVNRKFLPPDQAAASRMGWIAQGKEIEDVKGRWEATFGNAPSTGGRRAHDNPDNSFDRDFLVFAGLAQGIPDFPYQDESEVHDSTRPAFMSVESAIYTHPRFVLEVAKSWRSFNTARPAIGTCPYLLLMFVVSLHDELVVAEMERVIDDLIYRPGAHGAQRTRSYPMSDVRSILIHAKAMFGEQEAILQANLHQRLELFRWSSVHRSGNIFRYPKERGALEAIQKAMATGTRFDRAHNTIDRMESLVEDVANLKSAYASRRTNGLLLVLAIVGVIGIPKSVKEFLETLGVTGIHKGWFTATSVLLLGALLWWFLSHWRRGRRATRSR